MSPTRLLAAAALVGAAALPATAFANRIGIIARAQMGCGGMGCHDGLGEAPLVSVTDTGAVGPGGTATFTVEVTGGQTAAGFDIQAADGSLASVDSTLRLMGPELVHSLEPVAYVDGKAVVQFDWIAPDAPGSYDIFIAANSVNNDMLNTGDNWASISTSITVTGGGAGPDAGVGGSGDSGGGDDGGCAISAPGAPARGSILLFAALGSALILRRRRRP